MCGAVGVGRRLILSSKCDFFGVMMSGSWSEIGHNEMVFHFPDPLNVFPSVLEFLYTNRIEVPLENIPAVLALAEQMQIRSLKELLMGKLKHIVTMDNAFEIMQNGLQYPESGTFTHTHTRLAAGCVEYLAFVCVSLSASGSSHVG